MLFSDILARRKVISQKLWSLNSSKGKSWHVSQTSHSIRVDYWPRKRSNAPSSSNPSAEDEARHRKHAFASAASRDSYPTMTSSTDGGVARLRKGLATVTQPSTILSEWLIWACVCSAEISLRGRKYGWGLKKEKEGNGLIAISNVGAVLTETDFYLDVGQIIYSGFIKIITLTFGFIFEVFFISSNFNSQVSLKSSEATQPYSGSPRVFVFPYHSLSVKTLVLNTMVSIRAETFWRFNVFWRSLPSKCDENGFQKENLNGEMDMCSILHTQHAYNGHIVTLAGERLPSDSGGDWPHTPKCSPDGSLLHLLTHFCFSLQLWRYILTQYLLHLVSKFNLLKVLSNFIYLLNYSPYHNLEDLKINLAAVQSAFIRRSASKGISYAALKIWRHVI